MPITQVDFSNKTFGMDRLFNQEKFKEAKMAPYQERLDTISEKVDFAQGKISALKKLKDLITDIDKAAFDLSLFTFYKKSHEITTTEPGSIGTDHINVIKTESNANIGSIEVNVGTVATYAHTSVDKSGSTGYTLAEDISLGGVGDLEINITGQPLIKVPVAGGDTIKDLVDKCNAKLVGTDVIATLGKTGNNYYLKLKSTVTGVRNIAVTGIGNVGTGLGAITAVPGLNASITVDGKALTSTSNIFEEVETGISIEVKKANTGGNTQRIDIKHNIDEASKVIIKLLTAYNNFLEFQAIQTERDSSTNKAAEGAFLSTEQILPSVNRLRNIMTGRQGGISASQLNALASIGVTIETIGATKDAPSMPQFIISNEEAFKNAIKGRFNEVKTLFTNNFTYTAEAANFGSSLEAIISKNLNSTILGTNIDVRIDWNGVAMTNAEFSQDNGVTWVSGLLDVPNKTITFPNTVLDGVKLYFEDNGIGNHRENFTIKVTQGIANKILLEKTNLLNLDGKSGILDRRINTLLNDAEKLEKSKKSTQAMFDKKSKELEDTIQKMDFIKMQAEMSIRTIQAVLGNNEN